jgi:YfiR/HmsC-like
MDVLTMKVRAVSPLRGWAIAIPFMAGALLLAPLTCAAAPAPPIEFAVKAAYLSKFALFVEWPQAAFESPTSPVNLCVAGRDPFGATLDSLVDGQRIGARAIAVRRMAFAMRNSGCHILYVGGSQEQSVAEGLEAVAGDGVLTVTDASMPATAGILDFVIANGRVRFNVDEQAASMNRISISSHLLGLALSVKPRA